MRTTKTFFIVVAVLGASSSCHALSEELELEGSGIIRDAGPDGLSGDAGDTGTIYSQVPWKCEASRPLAPPERTTKAPIGDSHFASTCAPGVGGVADGAEDIYSLSVKEKTGLRIQVTTAVTTPIIRLMKVCDVAEANPGECTDATPTKAKGKALYQNVVDIGEYFVVVDQALNGAPLSAYVLETTTFTPAPNASCAAAQVLTPTAGSVSVNGDVRKAFDTANSKCFASDAGQLFYRATIPLGEKWTFTLTPSATWRGTIGVSAENGSCTPSACADKGTSATAGAFVTLSVDNPLGSGAPKVILISVSGTDVNTAADFNLGVVTATL